MITRCAGCGEQVRDCTGFAPSGEFSRVPVIEWYHTATGWRDHADGTPARPVPLVHVGCRRHDRPAAGCLFCTVSSQVSLLYHGEGRCITRLCRWPHVHLGLDGRLPRGVRLARLCENTP